MERLKNEVSHLWHCAINKHTNGKTGSDEWPRFMYEAKTAADEIPRMALLFSMERQGKLTKVTTGCSCCAGGKHIEDNHLSCCLGVKCRECEHLLALDKAKLPLEQIDEIKAWTCGAHILSSGGDVIGEGFLLTVDDRMYWDGVYKSLSSNGRSEEPSDGM